jgi:hypothetical protein
MGDREDKDGTTSHRLSCALAPALAGVLYALSSRADSVGASFETRLGGVVNVL